MMRVGFEPRPCRSQSRRFNYSTTLPTNQKGQAGFLERSIGQGDELDSSCFVL